MPGFPKNLKRILFDPEGTHNADQICEAGILAGDKNFFETPDEHTVKFIYIGLAFGCGISTVEMDVAPVDGGGNNKVFSVHTKSGKYLAKVYYSNPSDTRNRLNANTPF